MEKSIKRVEKLVHVTNSALAQMKFSLMFDDVNESGKFRGAKPFDPLFGEKFLDVEDLKRCQNEFKAEASDMLVKMESMFGSNEFCRKNAKAVDRIKEINRKMNHLRLEQSKPPEETEKSPQKLINLISDEKFSSGVTSSKDSLQSKNISFDQVKKTGEKPYSASRRTESILTIRKSPDKSKEELKNKILETQEIVNRGFETARQLAQRVETMSKCERKEKTPSTGKTVSEINLRSSEEKVDSNETVSNIKCRRRGRERKKKDDDSTNARVIDVRRKDVEVCRRSNLQLQRLPSVHIKGGLQVQKIHNLEIPAGGDTSYVKSNTAINFLSHEQMENEKMGEMIEKVKRENCCCTDDEARRNYVECFNCGKWIKIRETRVDPRKVDEILQKCNFDVFDPRIDEFVEKIGTGISIDCRERTQMTGPAVADRHCDPAPSKSETPSKKITRKNKEEHPKKDITLQTLNDQLLKKYQQEADNIESNHLKLDSILQNLFRQVDESREVFENCSLFRNKKSHFEREPKLTATKPVLISLGGTSFRIRKRQKKLEKRSMNYIMRFRSNAEEENERHKGSTHIKSVENEKLGGGITSLVCGSPSESSESERRNEVRGRLMPSSAGQSSSKRLTEMRKMEEGASSVTSSSTSRSLRGSKNVAGKEDIQSAVLSIQCGGLKPSDRISRKEETERKYLESSILSRRRTSDSIEMRKEEIEREKAPSGSSSSSSSKSRSQKAGQAAEREGDVHKPRVQLTLSPFQSLVSEAAVRKSIVTPSSKSDGKTISETSSDKSENNYESDFESMTNEPNEIVDECEEEEPEGNQCVNILSTISEVDSELEKKLSGEQKTLRSSRNAEMDDTSGSCEMEARDAMKREGSDVLCKQRKDNSVPVETSSESKKTEATPAKTVEISTKSTPTELVTSLKDILSALQDQFVRTESLAERLTENAKIETAEKTDAGSLAFAGDAVLNPWNMPAGAKLVENLRSARKDSNGGSKSQRRVIPPEKSASERSKTSGEHKAFSADSLSEEGGSSLGEIIASDRRRKSTEKSESTSISECSSLRLASNRKSTLATERRESNIISAFKVDLNSEDVVYSEGEIPSDELFAYECFLNGNVGELLTENNFVSLRRINCPDHKFVLKPM